MAGWRWLRGREILARLVVQRVDSSRDLGTLGTRAGTAL